ncbi:hypothetical protein RFF05_02910 [Bengtsoniella intestinalis]|uniref:hypothetical protein n=1 Tax=Bengtsoniella intestinalis TaxID=3073143 RepID=UPI00391F8F1A
MNRRYFAGFQLASLHTLPATLAICLAVAVLQVGYTYFQLQNGASSFYAMTGNWMDSIFRTGLLLVGAITLTPVRGKSSFGYFLRRLRLPSSHLGFLWATNALCCLVLFWGSQILVLWGCSALTQSMLPQRLGATKPF